METKKYEGLLSTHTWGEAHDILFLSSVEEPLAEELSWMNGKMVTVRYWITDKQATQAKAQECHLKSLYGKADVGFGSVYSEYTGYLWTDENLKVGGHDLIKELNNAVGKWLILVVKQSPE